MKMKVCKIIVCLIALGIALPVFSELPSEKNFNFKEGFKEGFIAYYATSGDTISEKIWDHYALVYYREIYDKYHDDEFMWRDSLSKIKKELAECIKKYDISTNYRTWSTRELEKYDFECKGFPLDISDFGYDDFLSLKSVPLGWIRLYSENPGDFVFLPYPEDAAQKFLQSRRNEYGDVDREVTVVVHFTLLPVKGEESQAVLHTLDEKACSESFYYSLVARINKIEVYEDEERTKKMGELTKTPSK